MAFLISMGVFLIFFGIGTSIIAWREYDEKDLFGGISFVVLGIATCVGGWTLPDFSKISEDTIKQIKNSAKYAKQHNLPPTINPYFRQEAQIWLETYVGEENEQSND